MADSANQNEELPTGATDKAELRAGATDRNLKGDLYEEQKCCLCNQK